MKFSSGSLSILFTATATVASSAFPKFLLQPSYTHSTDPTNTRRFHTRSLFGVVPTASSLWNNNLGRDGKDWDTAIITMPRGGGKHVSDEKSQQGGEEEGEEGEGGEVIPELYLPGLLSATVSKKSVSCTLCTLVLCQS